nr:hypothetical protein BdHM001_36480 [Bdellovibrio sp. HM001]
MKNLTLAVTVALVLAGCSGGGGGKSAGSPQTPEVPDVPTVYSLNKKAGAPANLVRGTDAKAHLQATCLKEDAGKALDVVVQIEASEYFQDPSGQQAQALKVGQATCLASGAVDFGSSVIDFLEAELEVNAPNAKIQIREAGAGQLSEVVLAEMTTQVNRYPWIDAGLMYVSGTGAILDDGALTTPQKNALTISDGATRLLKLTSRNEPRLAGKRLQLVHSDGSGSALEPVDVSSSPVTVYTAGDWAERINHNKVIVQAEKDGQYYDLRTLWIEWGSLRFSEGLRRYDGSYLHPEAASTSIEVSTNAENVCVLEVDDNLVETMVYSGPGQGDFFIAEGASWSEGSLSKVYKLVNTGEVTATLPSECSALAEERTLDRIYIVGKPAPPPLTLSPLMGDGYMNTIEQMANTLIVAGTTTPGAAVSVMFRGSMQNGIADGSGNFSFEYSNAMLSTMYDGEMSNVDVHVDGIYSGTETLQAFLSAPTISVDTVSGDDIIEAGEEVGGVTVSGSLSGVSASSVGTVDVVFNGNSYSATVQPDGSFNILLPEGAIVGAGDGNHSIWITATDIAGNMGTNSKPITIVLSP